MSVWMVRAGRGGENVDDFLSKGVVALGDPKLGPLKAGMAKEELLGLYERVHPDMGSGKRIVWASQFARFLSDIKGGDAVITFDRERRLYFVGRFVGEYEWAPDAIADNPHIRRVKWTHQVPRDLLAASTRNSLGAIQTLFKISVDVAMDLEAHKQVIGTAPIEPSSEHVPPPAEEQKDAGAEVAAETVEKADQFVEDAINQLEWDEVQDLVAGILRAMGYRTTVAPPGSDRGVDIFASPDGLGLQEPRIFVEVKHRTSTTGADKIRSFLGGRRPGDRCLYVSIGSFSKDARYEAERASVPMTLIDLQRLRQLLVDNYEALDAETRSLVPLRRIYWPVR